MKARSSTAAGLFLKALPSRPNWLGKLTDLLPATQGAVRSSASRDRARITLDSIADAVLTADMHGLVTYINPVAEMMTGWSHQEALDQPLENVFRVVDTRSRTPIASPLSRLQSTERKLPRDCLEDSLLEYTLIRRDGYECIIEDSVAPISDTLGTPIGAVIVFHDITASRAAALRMAHLAQHDYLTGLPNRLFLCERLALAIVLARRQKKMVGLLFLDLDNFKQVNDSLGHANGDRLLKSVGKRLLACVRETDTVCRQGGDEFVILLAEIDTPKDAAQVSSHIIESFLAPHCIDEHQLVITLSIGISIYPNLDDEPGDMDDNAQSIANAALQNADAAMYHAKLVGRNNFQIFQPAMNVRTTHRLVQHNALRRAVAAQEFFLEYQPQIDLVSGAIIGAEALIRWQDPERGVIYPEHFIGLAEEGGLIVPLGKWVLREACRQIRTWQDAGILLVPISINTSATEVCEGDFAFNVRHQLREFNLDANHLELEITESLLMQNITTAAFVLRSLREYGVHIALDDFGKGYSSLTYLKRLPINTLKIDRSFIQDIDNEEDDRSIIGAIINLGQNLRLRVIAEGVGSEKQLQTLQSLGCGIGQGSLFSPPLGASDFAALLEVRQ